MPDRNPELKARRTPRQQRAIETYELILNVTAGLLAEVGIERISTNLIAAAASIKPPTLYRYFPNKYAVLVALSDRLMNRQNVIVESWLTRLAGQTDALISLEDMKFLIGNTVEATRKEPGAFEIMLAMRAVPRLREVRLASHRYVADLLTQHFSPLLQAHSEAAIWARIRLSIELSYAATEMALEETMVPAEVIIHETARQISDYWIRWLETPITNKPSDN